MKGELRSGQDTNSHFHSITCRHPERGYTSCFSSLWMIYASPIRSTSRTGLRLIIFPYAFDDSHRNLLHSSPCANIRCVNSILMDGCFFLSSAIPTENDGVSACRDSQMPRGATRPVLRGAVSDRAAVAIAPVQVIARLICLLWLRWPMCNRGLLLLMPSLALHTCDPFHRSP